MLPKCSSAQHWATKHADSAGGISAEEISY